MTALARLDGLSIEVDGRVLLDGVDLEVHAGEAVGVLGPSGCGKTTLALAVLGHLRPGARHTGGRAVVDGNPMLPTPTPGVRGGVVGYLGQDPGLTLNPYAKVGAMLLTAIGTKDRDRVAPLLARVGLPVELAGRYPHQLSGGQQQRVALACALAREPRLLVLDEPTTALDVLAKAEVLRELARLRDSGVALLWISHDLDTVRSLADRVVVLDGGRLLDDSPATRALVDADVPRTPSTWDGPVALSGTGISAAHGANRVLHGVDLAVRGGECLAVLGVSGVGKSTFARCLAGLHRPSAGAVSLAGVELAGDVRGRTSAQRAAVQLVPQSPAESLHPRQSVRTALTRPLRKLRGMRRAAGVDAEVRRLLTAVGLPETVADRLPAELSGGQRQRVALARALAARPDVLVCDEITSALDSVTQAGVLRLLGELRAEHGLAVVFITHDAAVAAAVSDRVLVLAGGRVVASGPTDELLAHPEQLTSLLLPGRTTTEEPSCAT
jgi:peptide/nickel transport system ATP-binding protein